MGKEDVEAYCSGPSKFNDPILCHSGSMVQDIPASWTVKAVSVPCRLITC